MPGGVYVHKKHSEATKKKMSESHKGQIPWNKGIPMSEITKERLSKSKMGKYVGPSSCHWKGGQWVNRGYVMILRHEHPAAPKTGYIKRSRYVMEQKLGRYLKREEHVHHLNHIKTDDRPENLKLFPNESQHQYYHSAHRINL